MPSKEFVPLARREQWACLQAEKGPVSGRHRNGWVDKVWEERPRGTSVEVPEEGGGEVGVGTQNVSA